MALRVMLAVACLSLVLGPAGCDSGEIGRASCRERVLCVV